jgi:RNA polymerase-binding transcription factor DksA
MDVRVREALEGALRDRRAALLERASDEAADLALIAAERAVELVERAQDERTARLIARLDDQTRREIVEINAALDRMIEGSYGRCIACEQPIATARLRALPATALCFACAEQAERRHVPRDASRRIALPTDLAALSNREIEELVRRTVREDHRIDDEDLQIHYRRGVLRLAGTLPSEAQHTALRALLDDGFGIREVVDRVEVRAPPP